MSRRAGPVTVCRTRYGVRGRYARGTCPRSTWARIVSEPWNEASDWLLGGGRRLFGVLPSRVELEIVRVLDTPVATHIRYRVRR